jgi:serine/threonine protein kinase
VTAVPTQADLVGAVLNGKYALERAIGAGGMGAVYASKSPDNGRLVAIKVLASEYIHDPDVKSRFVEEGRMCQRLVHPNIVRVFDVAEAEDGTPYIVMELLEGVPLSAYTRSGVRVPQNQAATIMLGVLAALAAAHGQGIVHRDLKPENVFLARDAGGAFQPKILDFGIAKVMDVAGGMGNRTRTGVLLGTPAYMSPEQIKNSKDVDARSDLWSAGVMFYEMLTGRVAFPAPTEYARLAAVLNTTPATLESVDPQLARLSPFVQLAMQKDRSQRFPSAQEMARALAMAMGPEVGSSPSPALSKLPDVASVWSGSGGVSVSAEATSGATIVQPTVPPPPALPAMITPAGASPTGPGGTLASREGPRVSDPPPQVVVVGKHGTLPSGSIPMLAAHDATARRGVPPGLVVLFVLGALGVGFLLGFAAAKM